MVLFLCLLSFFWNVQKEASVYFCYFHFWNFLWPSKKKYSDVLEMFCLNENLQILSALNIPILDAIAKICELQLRRKKTNCKVKLCFLTA